MSEIEWTEGETLGQVLGRRFSEARTDRVRALVECVRNGACVEIHTHSGSRYRLRRHGGEIGVHKKGSSTLFLVHDIAVGRNRELQYLKPDGSPNGHTSTIVAVLHMQEGKYRPVWERHPGATTTSSGRRETAS